MAFKFCDSMLNDYISSGYIVFRGIVPPSLLRDLRAQAEKARQLAHELNGPQTQRIQPLAKYGDRLDLKPFHDYNELPELKNACERLLGPGYTHGHIGIVGLLVEPLNRPTTCGWHRDAVVEVPLEAQDEGLKATLSEVLTDLRYFNQINCAIYADSCTWFVPGSHLRMVDLPGERQSTGQLPQAQIDAMSSVEAERFLLEHCRQFPGAVQVHLGPGDFLLYRNLAWHNGNYIPYQPRATIHDILQYEPDQSWIAKWGQAKKEAVARLNDRSK